jgi:hypothetical protein
VRCEGRWHRLVLTPTGRLGLRDHTKAEVGRHIDFAAVGGEPCRCVAALIAWRRFAHSGNEEDWEALPKALREVARERHDIARSRYLAGCGKRDELSASPLHERPSVAARKINDLVHREWQSFPGITCAVEADDDRDDVLRLRFWKEGKRGRQLLRTTELPRNWFGAIYRKGLAVHAGHLVVQVWETPAMYRNSIFFGADYSFDRCRPVWATRRRFQIDQNFVDVARGPAGDFRVVRR